MDYLVEQYNFLKSAKPLMDKYDKRLENVAKHVTDFSDFDAAMTAQLLDNTEKVLDKYAGLKNLSDTTYSETVGPFKKHALNIVSTVFNTFDLKDLVSFQPLSQRLGALYYLVYKYASNKGKVSAGESVFSPNTFGTRSGTYSSMVVEGETVTWTYDSGTDSYADLAYKPILGVDGNHYHDVLEMTVEGTGTDYDDTFVYESETDTIITLKGEDNGKTVDITKETGHVSIGEDADVSGGTTTITYRWNSERFNENSDVEIPKVTIGVEEDIVQAERRQLLFDIMLDTTYDFDQQFGRDLNSEVQSAIIQQIQNELAYYVMGRMKKEYAGNQGETFSFDVNNEKTISLQQHLQGLFKTLNAMSLKIYRNFGRGRGNKIVAGDDLIELLGILPRDTWQPADESNVKGPYKAGRLLGKYDVYHNPGYSPDEFYMMYKGDNWWESPYFIGSYLPVMNSKFMMFPDMHGEQGYISMEAHKFKYPKMVVKGTLTDSSS